MDTYRDGRRYVFHDAAGDPAGRAGEANRLHANHLGAESRSAYRDRTRLAAHIGAGVAAPDPVARRRVTRPTLLGRKLSLPQPRVNCLLLGPWRFPVALQRAVRILPRQIAPG